MSDEGRNARTPCLSKCKHCAPAFSGPNHQTGETLIIRGGANVYPAEVERVMMEHPSIGSVAVLGVDDDRLGQKVAAAIQLADGIDAEDINEEVFVAEVSGFTRERLARYKVPEKIKIVAELPRNAMNKVVKPKLVSLFANEED